MSWLSAKLSKAVNWARDRVTAAVRAAKALLSRAAESLRAELGSPFRLLKSLLKAVIGEDRGFGFWWLAVTAAIALAVGLLVAALLSPVIGILAALVVGIWMLIRRGRSSHSRETASASLAD